MKSQLNTENHPCFNEKVKGCHGRVHLPVAPDCNVKCNYCDRKYDCVNESRPGVTSSILTPEQSVMYLRRVLEKNSSITVAGIAGPGDTFANPERTVRTLGLIRESFPDILLCVSTNGLNLPSCVDDLVRLRVSHVTVTVNTVNPETGARIYAWVRDGKIIYRGVQGAKLMLDRQLEGIRKLKSAGIIVKVNTIIIPGVNDLEACDVARTMSNLGVDIQNCMQMFPNPGAPFGNIREPSHEEISSIRAHAEKIIPQMKHCARCRADAVGLLGYDQADSFRDCLQECSSAISSDLSSKPYVAVATMEGALVNLHLGEAESVQIWGKTENGYKLVETRKTPEKGLGPQRWIQMTQTIRDCAALLVSGVGETPRQFLEEQGIKTITMCGFIEMGLKAVYEGTGVNAFKSRREGWECGKSCSGKGTGCG